MLSKRSISHALFALVVLAAAFAPSANAGYDGTYTVPFCDRSATGSVASWKHTVTAGDPPYFLEDLACAQTDGHVYRRFEAWGLPNGASSDWTFSAPDGTYVRKLDMYGSASVRVNGAMLALYARQDDASETVVASAGPGGSLGDGHYTFPDLGPKVIKLRNSLRCEDSAGCAGVDGARLAGAEETWHGAVVQLVDEFGSSFTSVSGDGWSETPLDGQRTIDYRATDRGAGVQEAQLLIDGALVQTNTSSCLAGDLVPCPLTTQGTFKYDTTKLSEGLHNAELRVIDGAQNDANRELSFTVRRPPVASGSTAAGPVAVTNTTWSGSNDPAVGDQLHGSQGSWIGSGLSFAYQWMRCDAFGFNCVPIAGATAVTYTPTPADIGHALQFCVTASNSGGSATECSTPTPPVIAAHPSSGGTPPPGDPMERPDTPGPGPSGPVPTSPTAAVADRGAPNGSPAADRVVLTALANNRSTTMKVKFGKRVPISGRLLGPGGVAIANAVLEVQTRAAMPGAAVATAGKVVTGRDGRFTYVAPAGPSRVVRIAYRSHSADSSFADTTDVTLLVTAGVTIKPTPTVVRNRHATIFTGRLLGKPIAKRGVVVDLQVFFRNKWRTFGAPRTTRAGRYRFRYRFMAGAATWKFRARVRRESSYPYLEGYSAKTVKVKVTS